MKNSLQRWYNIIAEYIYYDFLTTDLKQSQYTLSVYIVFVRSSYSYPWADDDSPISIANVTAVRIPVRGLAYSVTDQSTPTGGCRSEPRRSSQDTSKGPRLQCNRPAYAYRRM